jgi:hypothetical protein
VTQTVLDSGVVVPTARWLIEENAKPGTNNWVVTGIQTPHAIEGYANQVSAVPGNALVLFVNTTATAFHVEAYRMGYYQGLGGRLIATSDTVAGTQQAPATVSPYLNTVSCPWEPSLTMEVTNQWPPGNYLLKLVGTEGEQQYIPLTVRDDSSTAAYVMQNSVSCWQAYNLWGGYSLYCGRNGSGQDYANRARVVSFDRPYPQTWAQGAADFFGNEFPLLYQMEQLGLDMTYWTDVDLHNNPALLTRHKALFTLGHDEYWSYEMRSAAQSALNSGTNLAFLGANACYRQIRLQPSSVGPNRLQACYKDASDEPDRSGADHGRLEPGTAEQPREHPHRQHVSVRRGERRPCDHRRVVVDLGRVWAAGWNGAPRHRPRRVRPLCPLTPRTKERRRLRTLAHSRSEQLVRHHLLLDPRRRRGARDRHGIVGVQAV